PNDATVDDVRQAYELGHDVGLKAVALYRDGCKMSQPLSSGGEKDDEEEENADVAGFHEGNLSDVVTIDSDVYYEETIIEGDEETTDAEMLLALRRGRKRAGADIPLRAPEGGESFDDAATLRLSREEVMKLVGEV